MVTEILKNQDSRLGVLICGHGSRNGLAVKEFAGLVDCLRVDLQNVPVEYGYLEFARPIIKEALDRLVKQSVERVIAVPAMLFAAGHAKNDIPSVLNKYSLETGLEIQYGRELGINNWMIGAVGARVKEAIDAASKNVALSKTLLVVVGRGSSDPDANSNVAKITRMLVEGFGFGWGETVFSGVTFPLVEPGLRHAIRLGFKRIVVVPYFLFSGVLVTRIKQHTQRVANEYPEVEFLQAGYLGSHPLVIRTFQERINEVLAGNNAMNCSLCKYRSTVLGFESEVGLRQESHHHHVEGLQESCVLCKAECTGDCQQEVFDEPSEGEAASKHPEHSHDHTHSTYPHADHPLGPVTLCLRESSKSKEKPI